MAGDWIKFEVSTLDKSEVTVMAAALDLDPDAVVGKLLRVWAWADSNVVSNASGNAVGNDVAVTVAIPFSHIDRITYVSGFAKAMEKVGWLVIGEGTITFPKFTRHNGKTAKERALTNRRVANHRSRNASSNDECNGLGNGIGNDLCNGDGVTNALTREEKRREEDQEQSARGARSPDEPGSPPAIRRKQKITITEWLNDLDARHEHAVPSGDSIFEWAEKAGIPDEFLELSWNVFRDGMRDSRKQQKDWRQTYRNYVRKGYLKLWYFDTEGECRLTTVGIQAQRQYVKEAA